MTDIRNSTRDFISLKHKSNPLGFNFDNIHRNTMIKESLDPTSSCDNTSHDFVPIAKKTGTTVVGIVYKDGVIIGADTRETSEDIVVNKHCNKIRYLAPNIYCCVAGTSADGDKTTELISSELELHQMDTGDLQPRVVTACTLLRRKLYRYQGYIRASIILGGCDLKGPHVYEINHHGSTGKLPYTTMGSGALAAMSVFETEWIDDLSETDALALVKRAVTAGIFNDLGSGSSVDTCIIRSNGTVTMDRDNLNVNNVESYRNSISKSERLFIKNGATSVLKSSFIPHRVSTLDDVIVTSMES